MRWLSGYKDCQRRGGTTQIKAGHVWTKEHTRVTRLSHDVDTQDVDSHGVDSHCPCAICFLGQRQHGRTQLQSVSSEEAEPLVADQLESWLSNFGIVLVVSSTRSLVFDCQVHG